MNKLKTTKKKNYSRFLFSLQVEHFAEYEYKTGLFSLFLDVNFLV